MTYLLVDFPVTGYLIQIHNQNFKQQPVDEDQFSTEIDVESIGELDNEDIFNAIFLKKRSFFSSSRHTSVQASHRSENIEQKSDLALSLLD